MNDKNTFEENQKPYPYYEIRFKGHLDGQWSGWFEDMTITLEEDGNTRITGQVVDQAALHGVLKKVRDLGLPLVSINQIQFGEPKTNQLRKDDK